MRNARLRECASAGFKNIVEVVAFSATLPRPRASDVLATQLVGAGTSIGANYHEANRAESRSDFIHKIGVTEKEAAESRYWLEIFEESKPASARPPSSAAPHLPLAQSETPLKSRNPTCSSGPRPFELAFAEYLVSTVA